MNRGRSDELSEIKRRRFNVQTPFISDFQEKLKTFEDKGNANVVYLKNKIPHVPATPIRMSASGLKVPRKARSQTEFIRPTPRTPYGEDNNSDDDDDFRKPPKKMPRNPFAKQELSPVQKLKKAAKVKQAAGNEVLDQIDDSQDDEMDDFRSRKPETFRLPQKMTEQQLKEKEERLRKTEKAINTIKKAEHQLKFEADKVICPFCREMLHPMNDTIKIALQQIKERDQIYKEQQIEQLEKENAHSSFTNRFQMVQKRPASSKEKDAFCGLHKIELVIKPEGEERGYPATIDFNRLEHRMRKFDQELQHVICKKSRVIIVKSQRQLIENKAL